MSSRTLEVIELPKHEKRLYILIFALNIAYGVYNLLIDSSKYKYKYHYQSWLANSLTQDISDYEWMASSIVIIQNMGIFNILFTVVVDRLCRSYIPKFHKHIILLYSFSIIIKEYTIYGFALLLIQVIIYYLATVMFKSKIVIWILTISSQLLHHYKISYPLKMRMLLSGKNFQYLTLQNISLFFAFLRLVSFCLDKIDRDKLHKSDESKEEKEKHLREYTLFNFLLYIYYPSFLYLSPFISFQNFYQAFTTTPRYNTREIFIMFVRILFSFMLVELVLHTTLVYAIHKNQSLVDLSSKYTLAVSSYLKGSLFAAKYIFFYGIPTLVNKLVGMKTTPLPRCISLIHTNGELWKYFDTGIYEFIKNYLYIPLGGNKISKPRQILSLLLSFCYISYWHGHSYDVMIWSVSNLTMVICELMFLGYFIHNQVIVHLFSSFSQLNKRRIICLLMAFWQMILNMVAFFFLSDYKTTLVIYKRILIDDFPVGLSLFYLTYYCNSQLRLDITDLKL